MTNDIIIQSRGSSVLMFKKEKPDGKFELFASSRTFNRKRYLQKYGQDSVLAADFTVAKSYKTDWCLYLLNKYLPELAGLHAGRYIESGDIGVIGSVTEQPVKEKKERKSSPQAAAAKMIKAELSKAYPEIKFSVTSESFSMGNAVRVSWTDGATTSEVEKITAKYQYGHFNGMEDIYEYSNRRDDIPQTKWLTTSRKMSEEAKENLKNLFYEQWGRVYDDYGDYEGESGFKILHRMFANTSYCKEPEPEGDYFFNMMNELNELLKPDDEKPSAADQEKEDKIKAYNEKKEARIDRYRERSERANTESTRLYNKASEMGKVIPFGQPILVGHHSESRDRNFRNRIHNTYGKSFEAANKADYWENKAKAAESNSSISSDDPEAIDKLKKKIEAAEKNHEVMKSVNKIIRKKGELSEIQALGFTEKQAKELCQPDCMGNIGFASYSLSNNSSNIRKMKQRLVYLEKMSQEETREIKVGEVRIVYNVEDNRVQIFFPGIPEEGIRSQMKANGFRWARSVGAWQRQRSRYAFDVAKSVAEKVLEGAAV